MGAVCSQSIVMHCDIQTVMYISGYYTFVDCNLVKWRSKKQTVVARSSNKTEYKGIAHTA